ncbi:MAG: molybdopterin-guanine dinucleotide biosynthesis protein B [Candidatus Bathyarchaeota archaeon]|nr:molybdopterin-guanine dinucleotide biosynthesis protein B [Candidatus Bathyarchaeota archaeon]
MEWANVVVLMAAVGISGSGKTTTLEFLVSRLSVMGFKVGVIKHIHRENFTIDREGSNTWRFSRAGSKITVAFSPKEIAIIKNKKTTTEDLEWVIEQLKTEQLDIIFIEGFHGYIQKRPDVAKIVTAKTQEDLARTLEMTVPPVVAICGLVTKSKPEQTDIPYVDLPDEGDKLLELVKRRLEPR